MYLSRRTLALELGLVQSRFEMTIIARKRSSQPHNAPVLVSSRLLKPLGNPPAMTSPRRVTMPRFTYLNWDLVRPYLLGFPI